jgi:transcriptional regulator of PTS gene
MLKNIQNIHESTRCRIKDFEKALIFQYIYEGNAVTRKQLAESLRLRPTTVSNVVQELVSDNLVFEGRDRYPGKKGRPEIRLQTNFNRFTAIAVHVVSRELKGVLVNLGYETLADSSLVVPGDGGNSVLYRSIDNLASSLSRENPSGAELTGISLSLPGTVNLRQKSWISAARWPSLNNLKLNRLERSSPADISLCRFLDAELEYLLSIESGYRQGGTLLFHWGYGIGSAFAINGKVMRSTLGRFGECRCP